MKPGILDSPTELLYRVGYPPDPLAWPPPEYRGRGRFDDPRNRFGVMYAAADRRCCFLETLDSFRPDRALLQRLLAMGPSSFTPQSGLVPDSYFDRLLAPLLLHPGRRWLDARLTAPQTAVALSRDPAIARMLPNLGYGTRFKPGDLVGSDRSLTQAIAGWAHGQGFAGIAYSCSHDPSLDCWAVFEGPHLHPGGAPQPITPDDPDVVAVAQLFELTVSFVARP
jgi:hypothetical protein